MYRLHPSLLQKKMPEECLFCGASRKKEEWRSSILIVTSFGRRVMLDVLSVGSVCPKCRSKHTIKELYQKTTEKATKIFEQAIHGMEGEVCRKRKPS